MLTNTCFLALNSMRLNLVDSIFVVDTRSMSDCSSHLDRVKRNVNLRVVCEPGIAKQGPYPKSALTVRYTAQT